MKEKKRLYFLDRHTQQIVPHRVVQASEGSEYRYTRIGYFYYAADADRYLRLRHRSIR